MSDLGSVADRRARMQRRHRLDGSAGSAREATDAVLALHATDAATVHLSVWARAHGLDRDDVADQLYGPELVRLMAMRRTVFVVPAADAPIVHRAASLTVAAALRRTLLTQLAGPTHPPVPSTDAGRAAWLDALADAVVAVVEGLGEAPAATISAAVPALRTQILPTTTKSYDKARAVTSQVLTWLGAEGRLSRGRPSGGWTSRRITWSPGSRVWPDGPPDLPEGDAQRRLAEAYVRRFGPVCEEDLVWWTGWGKTVARRALAGLDLVAAGDGMVLADDAEPEPGAEPVAALLPGLDPTPMGWKRREWFLPADWRPLYDTMGNIGPTVWWGGEVVGAWAARADGEVVLHRIEDRGAAAWEAIEQEAARLQGRLAGDGVIPSFPVPLEKRLRLG